jgi:hypothetical protein
MEANADIATESGNAQSRALAPRAHLHENGKTNGSDTLSRALGWFSIGLGLAQLVAPARVARIAGAEPDTNTIRLMRALGAREFLSGVGILSGQHNAAWIRGRVAGDLMDLALLGRLMSRDDADRRMTGVATLAVAGVTALDVLAAKRTS